MIRPALLMLALSLAACGPGSPDGAASAAAEPAPEPAVETPEAVEAPAPEDAAPEIEAGEIEAPVAVEVAEAPPRPAARPAEGGITLAQMQARMLDGFERLDGDGNGVLSQAEISAAPGPAGQMLGRADRDGNGEVSRAEIEAGVAARFAAMDADGDGVLDASERPQRPGF